MSNKTVERNIKKEISIENSKIWNFLESVVGLMYTDA